MAESSSSDLGTANSSAAPRSPSVGEVRKSAESPGSVSKRGKTDTSVDYAEQNRQWDIRINLDAEPGVLAYAEHELAAFCDKIKQWGVVRYAYVGGIELGENPAQDDYQKLHCHAALILHSPCSRRSVIYRLSLDKYIGGPHAGKSRSFYISARNPFASFKGWLAHHSKEQTKVGVSYVALVYGEPPKQYANQLLDTGESKKVKQDDMLREVSYAYIVVDEIVVPVHFRCPSRLLILG